MQTVTIGTKNQIVIPKEVRKKIKGLKPGNKVMVYPLDEDTIAIKVDTNNWVEDTLGVAAEAWKDIDTTKYLDDLRNEWGKK